MSREHEKPLLGHEVPAAPSKTSKTSRNVKWVDGFRGLASFSVITTHLARAFDGWAFMPSNAPDWAPRFVQLPFIRLWPQGRIGVAIFAMLTGFVCAIKPLKQIRSGDPHAARDTLGKAAFKRPARLMLPGFLATLVAFVLCQLGLFAMLTKVDVGWLPYASAQRLPIGEEMSRLVRNLRTVWINGVNEYDDFQWTLLPLLKTSMFIYLTLMATASLHFRYRMLAYFVIFCYYWQNNQPDTETFYCTAYYGLMLSDLAQYQPFQELVQSRSWARRVISVTLMVLGFFIASYPGEYADWKPWSRSLMPLQWFFPNGTNLPKRFTALGLMVATAGIMLNNTVKVFLTTWPLQFLGRHSFAIYLTHGTVLRTVLIWMLFGFGGRWDPENKDENGIPKRIPQPGALAFVFWIPIWIVIVYGVAWLWTTYVDPFCERVSQWLMKKTFKHT